MSKLDKDHKDHQSISHNISPNENGNSTLLDKI